MLYQWEKNFQEERSDVEYDNESQNSIQNAIQYINNNQGASLLL